jgi:hypothetical protein
MSVKINSEFLRKQEELKQEHEKYTQLAIKAAQELREVEAELCQLREKLTNAEGKELQELIQNRAVLINKTDALAEKVKGLEGKRDAAYLAGFELAEEQAKKIGQEIGQKSREHRKKLDGIVNDLLLLRNGRGVETMTQDERDKRFIELETAVARMRAEGELLSRDASKAGFARERAINETARVRAELGIKELQE